MSTTPASYYQRHIFFCLNERNNGEPAAPTTTRRPRSTAASPRSRRPGLAGPGKVRVNKAGCLDRCAGGPIAVVYPEAVWYTYVDKDDIDEIVESHLKNGQVVERLLTPAHLGR
jgi:(2Fe-2S) ferredoxin